MVKKLNPRRFKIYKETPEQTLERSKKYIERFGGWSYPAELIDKLLLDQGVVCVLPTKT